MPGTGLGRRETLVSKSDMVIILVGPYSLIRQMDLNRRITHKCQITNVIREKKQFMVHVTGRLHVTGVREDFLEGMNTELRFG